MEYVTLGIALFGALGTIGTWIYWGVVTRKNLSIEIVHATYSEKIIIAYIMITNNSKLSISVNAIAMVQNNQKIYCRKDSTNVKESTKRSGNEVKSIEIEYSFKFPINLSSLTGDSGYLYFDIKNYNIEKRDSIDLIISTNRGNLDFKDIKTTYL